MSAAHHNSYAPGYSHPARVEPPADCASARAGGASRNLPTPYSAEEIATIRTMRSEGATWQKVADAIGRNMRALEAAAPRLGLIGIGAATWKAEQIATLRAMVEAKSHTHAEIAAAVNRSIGSVQSKIEELYQRPKRIRRQYPAMDRHRAQQHAESLKPAPMVSQAKERRCLCGCNCMFLSHGPGNRIRPECLGTYDHRHTGAV